MPQLKPSRLISIRLSHELEGALRAYAGERPWQTVLKEILSERLGLEVTTRTSPGEVTKRSSHHLHSALRKLHER
jgi:hypothetical protein